MYDHPLEYSSLRSQAGQEFWRFPPFHGQLGPMVFLWALGLFRFVFLKEPIVGLMWTLVAAGMGYGMARAFSRRPQVRMSLYSLVLEKHYLRSAGWSTEFWHSPKLQSGAATLAQCAMALENIERKCGNEANLRRVFADASGLLSLVYALSVSASELERSLALIPTEYLQPVDSGTNPGPETTTTQPFSRPRYSELRSMADQAIASKVEASVQLTLLLERLRQLEKEYSRQFHRLVNELTRESAEVLARLQVREMGLRWEE